MAELTKIQWTEHTFNPWRGCQKISPGCAHCYAETQSKRNPKVLGIWGSQGTRPIASEAYWKQAFEWNRTAEAEGRRHRVFCASMADVFEDREKLDGPRRRLFHLISATPFLDWQILTKRPEVMRDELALHDFYPPHLWVGVSVEDQEWANRRVPILLDIPARIRFLSCEPLLGPIRLKEWIYQLHGRPPKRWLGGNVNWVILGGESGGQARPCDIAWIRFVLEECRSCGTPVFVKQLGRRPIISGRNPDWSTWTATSHLDINRVRDPKGGDVEEWPDDLRIREFPGEK